MATADTKLVHQDAMLTSISVGYQNSQLVGDVLFPPVRVNKQSDKYYVFERRENWQVTDTHRSPGARANEVPPMTLSRETYFATEHALVGKVLPEEREQADAPLDPYADEVERVTDNLLLGREVEIATMATATANYASGHSTTLSGTAQWNDYTGTSDPIGVIKTGRDKIFSAIRRAPNVAVMGWQVAVELEDHPDFIERIKYSERGVTTLEIIGALVGIPRIVIASAAKDTSNPAAAAPTVAEVWGKDVVLAYVPPRPALKTPAYGYEFVWPFRGQVQISERWHRVEEDTDVVRVRRRYDLKFIATDANDDSIAGYLIKSAVA